MSLHHLIPLIQDYLDAETLLQRAAKAPAALPAQEARLVEVRTRLDNYAKTAPHDDADRFLLDPAIEYLQAADELEQTRSRDFGTDQAARRFYAADAELQDRLYRSVRNIQPEGDHHARRVLVAIKDRSESDAALYTAIHLAETTPTKLKLLHVVKRVDSEAPYDMLDAVRDANAMLARKQIEVPSDLECDRLVRQGDPAHNIVSAARRWAADFIVVGSHNTNRISPSPLPDTVEAVLKHAACPVIVVAAPAPHIETSAVGRHATGNLV